MDIVTVLAVSTITFVFVAVASFVGTMVALRRYHDDEEPTASAAVDDLRELF